MGFRGRVLPRTCAVLELVSMEANREEGEYLLQAETHGVTPGLMP